MRKCGWKSGERGTKWPASSRLGNIQFPWLIKIK